MALTSDNVISMHKVTTDVIDRTRSTNQFLDTANLLEDQPLSQAQIVSTLVMLNNAVEALAVVQRDLLAAMLGQ